MGRWNRRSPRRRPSLPVGEGIACRMNREREGGGFERHTEASGHGFPAAGWEERAGERAGFLAGETGVPENPYPGSPRPDVSYGRSRSVQPATSSSRTLQALIPFTVRIQA